MSEFEQIEVKKFFTTRPRLASYLLQAGFEGEVTLNPYDTKRPAWLFDKTDELLKCVENYFMKEDKP